MAAQATHHANEGVSPPEEFYSRRRRQLQTELASNNRRDRILGFSKLALLGVVFAGAIVLLHSPARLPWLLIPLGVFVVLAAFHEKVLRLVRHRKRVLAFCERGLARLNDNWSGGGETGERFLDPAHPYARDLDLFGRGSLFELLCTARTRAGEETLAAWLLAAAPLDTVLPRQAAVADLRPRTAFRERLFATSNKVRSGVHPAWLAKWGETKPDLGPQSLRFAMPLLALAWAAAAVYWMATSNWYLLLGVTVFNFAVARFLHPGLVPFVRETEFAAVDLNVLAAVLEVLEKEHFDSPLLLQLQARLARGTVPPSRAIRRLDLIVQFLESRRNWLVRVIDRPLFYVAQIAFVAEAWRRKYGASIREWLSIVGEFEALAALSTYAWEHPAGIFPEFADVSPCFDAESFAHPLLPESRAVRNDLRLDSNLRLVLISGPNMAGKSTFVRGVGLNAVLAQCGSVVQARRLRMSPLAVGASICVLDSLQGGVSRFYAEIQRLKLISDLTEKQPAVLFLLDELLSGTNSHDRLIGTQSLVRALVAHGAVGLITTHDLALTQIPETLTGLACNCHFEDHLEGGELRFDYLLKPGVVRTSNALKLMQSIGLAVAE